MAWMRRNSAVLRKQLRRRDFLEFLAKLPPTGSALRRVEARIIGPARSARLAMRRCCCLPQYAKQYLMRGKNDAADAEAICEAMGRPRVQTRFVPIKTAEQQAAQMLARHARPADSERRTQLSNAIRGYAAEFGLVTAKGLDKIEPLLARIAGDRERAGAGQGAVCRPWRRVCPVEGTAAGDRRQADGLASGQRTEQALDGDSHRRADRRMRHGDQSTNRKAFRSGRDFAAWIGLTPKDHSTAGKQRLGVITRAGDESLRQNAGPGRHRGDQAGPQGARMTSPWLVDAGQPQAAQARRRGARQQDRPHRLEADGQRRMLQPGGGSRAGSSPRPAGSRQARVVKAAARRLRRWP